MIKQYMQTSVGKSKRYIPTFVFLIFCLFNLQGTPDYKIPDFAFPKTVETQSDSLITTSLKSGNYLMVVRGVINSIISQELLDNHRTYDEKTTIFDSIIPHLPSPYKNLALLIESQSLDSYKITEENKERILELITEATKDISDVPEEKISKFDLILKDLKVAEKEGMTLRDFIILKSVVILKSLHQETNNLLIPFYPARNKETLNGRIEEKAKELLSYILESAACENELIKSIAILSYSEFLNEGQKEVYLKDYCNKLKGRKGEGIILYELWNLYGRKDKDIYKRISEWLRAFPDEFGKDGLLHALSVMNCKNIEVDIPQYILPGNKIPAHVKLSNVDKGYVLIYRVSALQCNKDLSLNTKKFKPTGKPVFVWEISCRDSLPFDFYKEIDIPALSEGIYVAIPSLTDKPDRDWSPSSSDGRYTPFNVSEISMLTSFDSNEKNSGKVYVVKGQDQEPVKEAKVTYNFTDGRKTGITKVTNESGYVEIPNGYYLIEAEYGKSKISRYAGFSYYPSEQKASDHLTILTDLAVYRPGDTISYAIVGWEQNKNDLSLIKERKITVSLKDAGYKEIGTDTLLLNREGRTGGKFIIPQGHLLGNYTIEGKALEQPNINIGAVSISVEEYKTPPFRVVLDQLNINNSDSILIKGIAETFTGMPVINSKVEMEITFNDRGRGNLGRRASNKEIYITDGAGEFFVSLPLSGLKGTIFERGRYSCVATVTSKAGETAISNPLTFYLGNSIDIRPEISDKTEVKGEKLTFNVPVFNMAGISEDLKVEYKIINTEDSTLQLKGSFTSPELCIESKNLASGKYRLVFECQGKEAITETVVWRPDDVKTPYPLSLWIPKNEIVYREKEKEIEITFGGYDGEWFLYVLSDGEKVLKEEWLYSETVLIKKKVNIPEGNPTLFINIAGMHDFAGMTDVITLVPEKSKERMEIETLSFRDKINSGDREEWIFKFKTGDRGEKVNAFAVMTDKALNSIREFKWDLNIWKPIKYSKYSLSAGYKGLSTSFNSFSRIIPYKRETFIPDWNTYGYGLNSPGFRYTGNTVVYRSMSKMASVADLSVENSATTSFDEIVSEERESVLDSSRQELRPVELPVAFFKDNLVSDDDGNVEVRFVVPDYNTTWQFQLTGYNDEVKSASLLIDATASKPIMIKTNLPSFLRTGDSAEISATVYNNNDSVIPVGVKLIIQDAFKGNIICETDYPQIEIDPIKNNVFSTSFEVPYDTEAIIVKAISVSKDHTDGEQGMVAILPSSTPVIDSYPFYANAEQELVEINVPRLKNNSNVTFRYCDNPVWEVLLSLPGLTANKDAGSLSTANSLFATLISNHIINNQPTVRETLKKIFDSKEANYLKSNLVKDSSLKITKLEQTPWVNDAETETQNISNIEYYLDKSKVSEEIAELKSSLKKLQSKEGGWSWFEGMKPSGFITEKVLNVLGLLNTYGQLNDDLKEMAKSGCLYVDKKLEEDWFVKGKKSISECIDYLYIRQKFKFNKSQKLKTIETECIDSILKQWRYFDIPGKAKSAYLLRSIKGHEKDAEVICNSLSQFINSQLSMAEMGILINLFASQDKYKDERLKIEELLLLRKETESWINKPDAPTIIVALLSDLDSKDLKHPVPEVLIADSQKLNLPSDQQTIGNYTVDLDKFQGGTIKIKRDPGKPAWGGIVAQYIQPIKEVTSLSVPFLKIEKELLKEDEKGKIKQLKELKKGDKVKVVLKIEIGKDMDYVVITDSRGSFMNPDNKLSGLTFIDNLLAYFEFGKEKTSFFIEKMKAGKYELSYDCHVDREGDYSIGIASIQSLYSPIETAHTKGELIRIE